jgi:hydrogenase nickel incorporation protein HypA/HybF
MHELSLVRALLRQLDDLVEQYPGQRLISIRVEIGEFSGVEPEFLSSAFSELASQGPYSSVDFVVERTVLRAACEACGQEFRVLDFKFLCPSCGSPRLCVLGGDEMMLDSMTLEDYPT